MTCRIVVGLDGTGTQTRTLAFATRLAKLIGDCELVLVYVIEWSPFTFQTPEENEQRHKRREEEIATAHERIIEPALAAMEKAGVGARGVVRHGHVADLLDEIAKEEGAEQIVVARTSESGFSQRIFGSATSTLVMHASVPVTVVA